MFTNCLLKRYSHFSMLIYQDKLVPYFGNVEQVGFAYFSFKQKLQVFGIVEPNIPYKHIYVCDKENSGPKDGNLVVNYLLQYVPYPLTFK